MPLRRATSTAAPWWLRQGVPDTARRSVFNLYDRITKIPGIKERVGRILADNNPNNEDGVFTWGTFLNPGRNVVPVVIAALPDGMFILDGISTELKLSVTWDCFVRCDLRASDAVATVGMAWYDGQQEISERLATGRLLQDDELTGGFFFVLNPELGSERDPVPSNTAVFQWIGEALNSIGVPESAHKVPKLI